MDNKTAMLKFVNDLTEVTNQLELLEKNTRLLVEKSKELKEENDSLKLVLLQVANGVPEAKIFLSQYIKEEFFTTSNLTNETEQ